MPARESLKARGEKIGKLLFGATLTNQGRGYYVALELLALVRGTLEHSMEILPASDVEMIQIRRRSHDFARRLMGEPRRLAQSELRWLGDETTIATLSALITGLCVPIPGRRRRPSWLGEHLYPYIGDLVHYDAAERKKRAKDKDVPEDLSFRVSIERYAYRGAGGLAHKILRTDEDAERLEANREGLHELVADSGTPLGQLFRVLLQKDIGRDEGDVFEEKSEMAAEVNETKWVQHLRTGTRRITARRSIPVAKRVEALMHWVPYCIARHQLEIAEQKLGVARSVIPVDCQSQSLSIRRVSREQLNRHHAMLLRALEMVAEERDPELLGPKKSKTWRDSCRSFYSGTLGTVGALNAMTGQRYYSANPELLETLVLASLEPQQEITFESFCHDVLLEDYGLVIDRASAVTCRELGLIDRSNFDDNAAFAAESLRELGLLHDYSDMTRMVKGEMQ